MSWHQSACYLQLNIHQSAELDAEKDKELEEWSKEYEAIKNYKLIEEIVDHD